MWLKRGLHHLAPAKIERFIREGRQYGWECYELPQTPRDKTWSFEYLVRAELTALSGSHRSKT